MRLFLLFISVLAGVPGRADQLPHGIKQISFYYDRQVDGDAKQQVFVIQEEKIKGKKYYVVMMHIGDDGLQSRPEDPRQVKVLPESLVTDLRRWFDTIVTEPAPSYSTYSFHALCGRYGSPFGMTLRMWNVGLQMPYGNESSIRCQGASRGFFKLRRRIENVYWQSDRSLFALNSEIIELNKLEALFRQSFLR